MKTNSWDKVHKYIYHCRNITHKGYFNIYQAANGEIYLQMNNDYISLTKAQVEKLRIDIFALEDFDDDLYINAYG